MTVYVVEYAYDPSRTEDLATLRPVHREFLAGLAEDGTLLASGPWLDNAAPGALLLIAADDADAAQRVLDEDPFHRARLIVTRTLRPWNPVIGRFADLAQT